MNRDERRLRKSKLCLPPQPPLMRVAVVLLALLQFIAPTWHVCELGGKSCHSGHEAKTKVWKPKCGGGRLCRCIPPKGAVVALTGQLLTAPGDESCHGTCLALLLTSMPGSIAAPIPFASFSAQRTAFAPTPLASPAATSMPLPPSRGPPPLTV